jgi:hypothetical protein
MGDGCRRGERATLFFGWGGGARRLLLGSSGVMQVRRLLGGWGAGINVLSFVVGGRWEVGSGRLT